jgi:transposase
MTGEQIERWFEYKLLNEVQTGCPIIMYCASFNRKKHLEEICGKAHVNLVFLPE